MSSAFWYCFSMGPGLQFKVELDIWQVDSGENLEILWIILFISFLKKKICNRLSNTKIISEFNATLATVLTKKGWKNFKKCYNFMLYAFHATNVFPSLLRTVGIYSVRIPFILWEFHALKFELLVKKRDVTIKTMQIFFSFEDFLFFRLMQFMFLKVFFSCSISKLRNPSTVCTVKASCSPVILGTRLFLLSILM